MAETAMYSMGDTFPSLSGRATTSKERNRLEILQYQNQHQPKHTPSNRKTDLFTPGETQTNYNPFASSTPTTPFASSSTFGQVQASSQARTNFNSLRGFNASYTIDSSGGSGHGNVLRSYRVLLQQDASKKKNSTIMLGDKILFTTNVHNSLSKHGMELLEGPAQGKKAGPVIGEVRFPHLLSRGGSLKFCVGDPSDKSMKWEEMNRDSDLKLSQENSFTFSMVLPHATRDEKESWTWKQDIQEAPSVQGRKKSLSDSDLLLLDAKGQVMARFVTAKQLPNNKEQAGCFEIYHNLGAVQGVQGVQGDIIVFLTGLGIREKLRSQGTKA